MTNEVVLVPKEELAMMRSIMPDNEAIFTTNDLLSQVIKDYNGGLGDSGYSTTPIHLVNWPGSLSRENYRYNSYYNNSGKIVYLTYDENYNVVFNMRDASDFEGSNTLYVIKNSIVIFERGRRFDSDIIGTQLKFQNSDHNEFTPVYYALSSADAVFVGTQQMMITLPDSDENAPT